jgi:hypothetical protein
MRTTVRQCSDALWDQDVPVAEGDGEEVTDSVGVGGGFCGAELPVVREDVDEVLDGRGGVDEVLDERGGVDERPVPFAEDDFWVGVGVAVVGGGAGARVSVGVVTTPTTLRAGPGAGRTSRYVTSVRRNMMLSTTVDVRARCGVSITPCPLVAPCRGRAAP